MGFVYLQARAAEVDVHPKDVTGTCCLCVCGHCKLIQPLRTAWDAAEAAGGNVEMLIVAGKHQEN